MKKQNFARLAVWAIAVLGAVSLTPSAQAQKWGTLEGQFIYDGPVPEPEVLDTSKDRQCCQDFNVVNEIITVGEDGGLANVVIYVRSKVAKIHPDVEAAFKQNPLVKLNNKGCRFEPHVMALWFTEQELEIGNGDACTHNSNLQPILDKGINPLLAPESSVTYKFSREQNVPQEVSCNIHPWMKARVLPRSNPYFAVTGPDGKFKIENMPAGAVELQVWHESVGFLAADPAWKTGRVKLTIKEGMNQLGTDGVVKVSPDILKK